MQSQSYFCGLFPYKMSKEITYIVHVYGLTEHCGISPHKVRILPLHVIFTVMICHNSVVLCARIKMDKVWRESQSYS